MNWTNMCSGMSSLAILIEMEKMRIIKIMNLIDIFIAISYKRWTLLLPVWLSSILQYLPLHEKTL